MVNPNGELYSSVPCSHLQLPYNCHSRNIFAQPHLDLNGLDTLTTGYHTLLMSVLLTWSSEHALSQTQFIDFVKSVIDCLPSSSSQQRSTRIATLGDHIIDMIWSVDAVIDEVSNDAKATLSAGDSATPVSIEKAKLTRQNAEKDKEGLQVIVKRLLVYLVHVYLL